MSLRILPSEGVSQHPANKHSTPTRSERLRAALAYAERGKPVFPIKPGDKKPVIPKCPDAEGLVGEELADHARSCSRDGHGLYDASTDPRKAHSWWTRWPNANLGMPTGERSGVWVLDVDRPEALEELAHELPETTTIRTPRGGTHLYFRHVEGITNSSGALPEGIDVRGEGGYVLAPPSDGYRVQHKTEVAEAPEWLLELVRKRKEPSQHRERRDTRPRDGGERIPEGQRNATLFFEALRLKDQGSNPAEVLDELLAANESRCTPPLDASEVKGIVRSAMRYPVRSGSPSPEVLEAVEQLEAEWWERTWPGMGGKTDRDVMRVLLELARRYGRLEEDGSVAVSASVRSVALAAATTFVTVSGGATKRLTAAGLVQKPSGERKGTEAGTWVLARPAFNTQSKCGALPRVKDPSRPNLWDLETPAFRWTGWVKKGRAGVLYLLEARGPMRLEELAELMGWSRPRDLRARYVGPLVELGLVKDCGGVLALPDGHAERVEEIRRAPYTTVRRRRRESKDGSGRIVRWVEESENAASEVEREEKDRLKHEKQRQAHRLYLAQKSSEADERCRGVLNAVDEERWAPDGEISELESVEPCIHDVPSDPSMRMPRAECWLCGREGAA